MEEERLLLPEKDSDAKPAAPVCNVADNNIIAGVTTLNSASITNEETRNKAQKEEEEETLEDRAIRFLLHSSVSDLDLGQKLYFLESKGFTSPQIQSILHKLQNVRKSHLESAFQKTFGASSITPPRGYDNNLIPPSQNSINNGYYNQHHNHQQQQQKIDSHTNIGNGNMALVGLIGGIVTMIGMAGWRWLNGGDFELIPPPRIVKNTDANETDKNVGVDSPESDDMAEDDDYLGMNFYSPENTAVNAKEKEEEKHEEKRVKSKALTNSAMDYLLRGKNNAYGVQDKDEQLPLQDQLRSVETNVTSILESLKAKEGSNDNHSGNANHAETIQKIEQIKVLLSTISNTPCNVDDTMLKIKEASNVDEVERSKEKNDLDITKKETSQNEQSRIPVIKQEETPLVEQISDAHSTLKNDRLSSSNIVPLTGTTDIVCSTVDLPQNKDENTLSNPTETSIDSNEIASHDVLTLPLSFGNDDTVFANCLSQLIHRNNHNASDLVTTLSTIQMYCNNIMKYKDTYSSSKYSKVHTNNPIFKKYIQQTSGAMELLESIGFTKASQSGDNTDIGNAMEWKKPSRWVNNVTENAGAVDDDHQDRNNLVLDDLSHLRKVCEELQSVKQQVATKKSQEKK